MGSQNWRNWAKIAFLETLQLKRRLFGPVFRRKLISGRRRFRIDWAGGTKLPFRYNSLRRTAPAGLSHSMFIIDMVQFYETGPRYYLHKELYQKKILLKHPSEDGGSSSLRKFQLFVENVNPRLKNLSAFLLKRFSTLQVLIPSPKRMYFGFFNHHKFCNKILKKLYFPSSKIKQRVKWIIDGSLPICIIPPSVDSDDEKR